MAPASQGALLSIHYQFNNNDSRFKPRPCSVRRVFHLSLRRLTFGDSSAYLEYNVHKSGRKTSTTATFNSASNRCGG